MFALDSFLPFDDTYQIINKNKKINKNEERLFNSKWRSHGL